MSARVLLTDPIDPAGERLLAERGAKFVLAPDGAADTVRALRTTRTRSSSAAGCPTTSSKRRRAYAR